jgi:uncharacterized protein (TIGR02145 family)
MSYQAVIRNSSDNLITGQSIRMKISILQGSPTGMAVYAETQTPTTNANGLVSIEIGNGTVVTGNFSSIDWTNGTYFIKTETDPTGGTSYTITGVSQLLSVPYALHAKTAETVTSGITETDPAYTASPAANITTSDITKISNLSGTNTGDQDLSGLATKAALNDSTAQVRSEIPDVSGFLSNETDPVFTAWDKDYNDLINKPTLFDGNYDSLINLPALFSGSYTDLTNKPTTLTGYGITDAVATSGDQTIAGNKTLSGTTVFTGTTTVPTPVNATDAVTKAYVDALLVQIEVLKTQIEPFLLANGFTDPRDGNHYNVVKIGNQLWMSENLKYLPSVTGPGTGSEITPYYYVYDYNGTDVSAAKATANYNTYGVLYNWPAAMAGSSSSTANPSGVQGVCPAGWHLPSDAEWTQLTNYLGGESVAGGKLKETGTTHWNSPNSGATNEVGFTALPGGQYESDQSEKFIYNRVYGFWWSTTEYNATTAWDRDVYSEFGRAYKYKYAKQIGLSVRCVRD